MTHKLSPPITWAIAPADFLYPDCANSDADSPTNTNANTSADSPTNADPHSEPDWLQAGG